MEGGTITIGTKLSTDKFDKQIKELEKKISKEEDKKIIIDAQLDIKNQELDRAKSKVEALKKAYSEMSTVLDKIQRGQATAGQFAMYKDYEKQYGSIGRLSESLAKAESSIPMITSQIEKLNQSHKQINQNVTEYEEKITTIELQKQQAQVDNMKRGFDGVGKSLQNAVQKASKLVLGIFGIRSAFMLMRRASSELASYDDEYAANLEYIRYVLVQAIAPVLEYVVNLAMKLLAYINAIAQAWFGVNLFERGSVDNFKKMKQGVGGVTGAVKELKKQLAGFDEINVLQEDGSVGSGITLPTMDLSNIQDIEIPKWVQWIIDHGTDLLGILTAVAAIIAGIKIASFINGLKQMGIAFGGVATQIGKYLAGAALVAGGIAIMIGPIDNLVKNWNEMTEAERLAQIGLVVLGGVLEAFGLMMMGVSGPYAAAISLATAIGLLIIKWEEESIRIDDVKQAQERLTEAREKADKQLKQYTQAVDRADEAQRKLEEAEKNSGITGEELNKMVTKNKDSYREFSDEQKEVYKLFLENEEAQKNLNSVAEETQKAIEDETDTFWLQELATMGGRDALEEWKKEVIKATETGSLQAEDAARIFSKALTDVKEDSHEAFKEGLEKDIQDAINPNNFTNPLHWLEVNFGETFQKIGGWGIWLVKTLMNIFSPLGSFLASVLSPIKNAAGYIGGWIGSFGQAKGAVVYHGLPRLASGGIINQPGRGVPIGRAIAGERGAERSYSTYGFTANGDTRRGNRKIYYNKCKYSSKYEWKSNKQRIKTSTNKSRICI